MLAPLALCDSLGLQSLVSLGATLGPILQQQTCTSKHAIPEFGNDTCDYYGPYLVTYSTTSTICKQYEQIDHFTCLPMVCKVRAHKAAARSTDNQEVTRQAICIVGDTSSVSISLPTTGTDIVPQFKAGPLPATPMHCSRDARM